jgi:hypothetical protein
MFLCEQYQLKIMWPISAIKEEIDNMFKPKISAPENHHWFQLKLMYVHLLKHGCVDSPSLGF